MLMIYKTRVRTIVFRLFERLGICLLFCLQLSCLYNLQYISPLIIKAFTRDLIQHSTGIIAIKLPSHIIHISYENLTIQMQNVLLADHEEKTGCWVGGRS